jgi:hypothetical protein
VAQRSRRRAIITTIFGREQRTRPLPSAVKIVLAALLINKDRTASQHTAHLSVLM